MVMATPQKFSSYCSKSEALTSRGFASFSTIVIVGFRAARSMSLT
jgi:hypothetical protein